MNASPTQAIIIGDRDEYTAKLDRFGVWIIYRNDSPVGTAFTDSHARELLNRLNGRAPGAPRRAVVVIGLMPLN